MNDEDGKNYGRPGSDFWDIELLLRRGFENRLMAERGAHYLLIKKRKMEENPAEGESSEIGIPTPGEKMNRISTTNPRECLPWDDVSPNQTLR